MWVEYAHNTLPCVLTGMSPFQCVFGYQPPLFPALEKEVSVPSAVAMTRCCWEDVGTSQSEPSQDLPELQEERQ